MPKKAGRPRADVDFNQLRSLLRLNPTLDDVAAFFDVTRRTIERIIRREAGCDFVTFREQNMVHTRLNIVRKAIHEATRDKPNTAMLIFCLKNLCGWKDQISHAGDDTKPIMFGYDPSRKLNSDV